MCKGPEAAVRSGCLNSREEASVVEEEGVSRGYEGREGMSHWEEPGLHFESHGRGAEERQDQICIFGKLPGGWVERGQEYSIRETGHPGK